MKFLADTVALIHGILVVYAAGGTALIVIGVWRHWEFTRNFLFRYTHLILALSVTIFEWANLPCPFTSLEWYLRGAAPAANANAAPNGFIQHYVTETIHVHVQPGVLAWLTTPWLIAVAALYLWAGPRKLATGSAMNTTVTSARKSQRWLVSAFIFLAVGACVAACHEFNSRLCELCFPSTDYAHQYWPIHATLEYNLLFIAFAFGLCLISPRACGLGLGSLDRWKRHDLACAAVMAVPPILVATVYAHLTSKPFAGSPIGIWLFSSIAQELLFTGAIYGIFSKLWGAPSENIHGAFAPAMLLTPLLFALWHWPNARSLESSYFAFQLIYVLIGGWWMLNIRRWTGSLWPSVATHVLVNFLAANV